MNLNILDINKICNGQLYGSNKNSNIQYIITNSRFLITSYANKTLFVAIKGTRNNGHNFIEELYRSGVKAFIIEQPLNNYHTDATYILVNYSIDALQKIATYHRIQFNYQVIGITGSYGKSIVKEWLYDILNEHFNIIRSPKSYNSQIGVPLSVLQMEENHNLAIIEAGISQTGEMEKLENIIKPHIGIFTNIGKAHQEYFTDLEQKISEKLKLFKNVKYLIVPSKYKEIIKLIKILLPNKTIFTWGNEQNDTIYIENIKRQPNSSLINFKYNNNSYQITVPFTQEAFIDNILTCILCSLQLNIPIKLIKDKIVNLKPIEMRLEMIEGINNTTIINDYYNSDLTSISVAIQFLQQQNKHPNKVVILSDIPSTAESSEIMYSTVSQWLKESNINTFVGIGQEISNYKHFFTTNSFFFSDVDSFITNFPVKSINNSTILLKGARKFTFERIRMLLQKQTHETTFNIDMNALLHNFHTYKSLLPQNTKIIAMVKAFSYGSGLLEIARLLQDNHADYLAVAYADEGIELRKHGIHLPIMVMNPEHYTFQNIIEYRLEPVIYNFKTLALYNEIAKKSGFNQLPFHLKIDTGMHRLGFTMEDIPMLIEEIKKSPWLKLESVFTHLASSDEPKDDNFTKKQLEIFNSCVIYLKNNLKQNFLTHAQNSAAIERFNNHSFDMARIGIGLYGIAQTKELKNKLQPVLSFKTVVSQIKKLKKGDTIGYNRKGIMKQDGKIAVLPIGYADGLNRKLGNGNFHVKIKNQYAPTIGNICMDMCMIDVSHIDVQEGDEVIVFDTVEDIEKIAKILNTIPYEILTSISHRVKRIYYHE
jgi:alanine racemase